MSQQHTYRLCLHIHLNNSIVIHTHYPTSYFNSTTKQLQGIVLVHSQIRKEHPNYPQARMGLIETMLFKGNLNEDYSIHWTISQ